MAGKKQITDEQISQMRALRAKKLTLRQIARIVGVTAPAVYYWTNSDYRERAKQYNSQRWQELRPLGPTRVIPDRVYANIQPWQFPPEDTRTPISRLLGDPLPGRSALDMMEELRALDSKRPSNIIRPAAKDEDVSRGAS